MGFLERVRSTPMVVHRHLEAVPPRKNRRDAIPEMTMAPGDGHVIMMIWLLKGTITITMSSSLNGFHGNIYVLSFCPFRNPTKHCFSLSLSLPLYISPSKIIKIVNRERERERERRRAGKFGWTERERLGLTK